MAQDKVLFQSERVRQMYNKLLELSEDTNLLRSRIQAQVNSTSSELMGKGPVQQTQQLINRLTMEAEDLAEVVLKAINGVERVQRESMQESNKIFDKAAQLAKMHPGMRAKEQATQSNVSFPAFIGNDLRRFIERVKDLAQPDPLEQDPVVKELRNRLKIDGLPDRYRIDAETKLKEIFDARNYIAQAQKAYEVYKTFGNGKWMNEVHAEAEACRKVLRDMGIDEKYIDASTDLKRYFKGSALMACKYNPSVSIPVPVPDNEQYRLLLSLVIQGGNQADWAKKQLEEINQIQTAMLPMQLGLFHALSAKDAKGIWNQFSEILKLSQQLEKYNLFPKQVTSESTEGPQLIAYDPYLTVSAEDILNRDDPDAYNRLMNSFFGKLSKEEQEAFIEMVEKSEKDYQRTLEKYEYGSNVADAFLHGLIEVPVDGVIELVDAFRTDAKGTVKSIYTNFMKFWADPVENIKTSLVGIKDEYMDAGLLKKTSMTGTLVIELWGLKGVAKGIKGLVTKGKTGVTGAEVLSVSDVVETLAKDLGLNAASKARLIEASSKGLIDPTDWKGKITATNKDLTNLTDAKLKELDQLLKDGKKIDDAQLSKLKGIEGTGKIDITEPTLSLGGKPKGKYEKPDPNELNPITFQNEAADLLANKGYDIEMLPNTKGGNGYGIKPTSNPDFLIHGKAFDCYSPETLKVRNIWATVVKKTEEQASRIVMNLDGYKGSLDDLYEQFNKYEIPTLDELIIIKDGQITRLKP